MNHFSCIDGTLTFRAFSLVALLAAVALLAGAAPGVHAKGKHQDCDSEAAEERGCQYTPAHPETGGKSHTNGARTANPASSAVPAALSKTAGKSTTAAPAQAAGRK